MAALLQRRTKTTPVRTVSVPLAPPAYTVRQQAGLGVPTVRGLLEAVAGYALGAGATATVIAVLPAGNKFIGAGLGLLIGGLLVATSPIGTLAQDTGAGAFISGLTWFVDDFLGPLEQPAAGGAAREGG
jgi:hypothetical protein